jgi:hypothetical protein
MPGEKDIVHSRHFYNIALQTHFTTGCALSCLAVVTFSLLRSRNRTTGRPRPFVTAVLISGSCVLSFVDSYRYAHN